ncbi:MAG: hypothetical protein GY730_10190 [bacterium]|nr:hypothetical protein [bacterium]
MKSVSRKSLKKIHHDILIDFVLDQAEKSEDLYENLLLLVNSDAPDTVYKQLNTKINSIKRSQAFVNYGYSFRFADELQSVLDAINQQLLKSAPDLAEKLILKIIKIHPAVFERADDSSGSIGDVFRYAIEAWKEACIKCYDGKDKTALIEKIANLYLDDDYGITDDVIKPFGDFLSEDELEQLKKLITENKKGLSEHMFKHALLQISDAKGSVDDYIGILETSEKINASEVLNIVDRLIQKDRLQEALGWLEKGQANYSGYMENDFIEKFIVIYDALKNQDKANHYRWVSFEKTLCTKKLQRYLSCLPDSQKEKAYQKGLAMIMAQSSMNCTMEALCDLDEIDHLVDVVMKNHAKIDGGSYYSLGPIAKKLAQLNKPLPATLIYRRLVDDNVKRAISKYYPYAARDLVLTEKESKKVGDWEGIQSQSEYMQHFQEKHARKTSFWREYQKASK